MAIEPFEEATGRRPVLRLGVGPQAQQINADPRLESVIADFRAVQNARITNELIRSGLFAFSRCGRGPTPARSRGAPSPREDRASGPVLLSANRPEAGRAANQLKLSVLQRNPERVQHAVRRHHVDLTVTGRGWNTWDERASWRCRCSTIPCRSRNRTHTGPIALCRCPSRRSMRQTARRSARSVRRDVQHRARSRPGPASGSNPHRSAGTRRRPRTSTRRSPVRTLPLRGADRLRLPQSNGLRRLPRS